MRFIPNVQGSEQSAQPLIVGKDTVYVHTNIKQIEVSMGVDTEEVLTIWQYDEYQYTLQEFIQLIGSDSDTMRKRVFTPDELYKQIDVENTNIEDLREAKNAQLNYLCEKCITDGFQFQPENETKLYRFSYDTEAQLNFQGSIMIASTNPQYQAIWTCYDEDNNVCRVILTASDFAKLPTIMVAHKDNAVSKYRDTLQPQLKQAKTKEEIDSINW